MSEVFAERYALPSKYAKLLRPRPPIRLSNCRLHAGPAAMIPVLDTAWTLLNVIIIWTWARSL